MISLDTFITNLTQSLKDVMPPEIIIFLISLFPVLELRGGIIAGTALGVNWPTAYILCVIANMIPVPFIILFIRRIFEWLKNTRFVKLIKKIEEKAEKKSNSVRKYKSLGLFILVAIPLPGTGAWTGALVAALLDMRLKDAFLPILFGVMTAGLIVALISYGVFGFIA